MRAAFRAVATLIVAAAPAFCPPARAAEAGVPVRLTVEDALRRAAEASPLVRRARRERDVVAAERVGAATLLPANPIVAVGVGGRRDSSGSIPPASGPEVTVHLEQQIEIAGQRGTRLAVAARALEAADARERLALAETRARVRAAYATAQLAEAQLQSARRLEELGARVLEAARARVGAGAASSVEQSLAEMERGRLEADRREAELGALAALDDLRLLVDLPATTGIALATPLAVPDLASADLQRLVREAELRRRELEVLAATRRQLDAELVRLRREIVPNPALFGDVMLQQPGQLYAGGGIALALPLWRRNQGPLAVTRAELARNQEERRLVAHAIELEVAGALRAALQRADEVRRWDAEVVPAADAAVELVTAGWRAGKFDIFRVVQTAREAGEAQRRRLVLLGALWDAVIALDRAVGAP